jgi:hypothetical protein
MLKKFLFSGVVSSILAILANVAVAFSVSDARTCGRVVGAMATCGMAMSEQRGLLSRCMNRTQGAVAVEALLDGVEEGSWLAPNASGWSCAEVRGAARSLGN